MQTYCDWERYSHVTSYKSKNTASNNQHYEQKKKAERKMHQSRKQNTIITRFKSHSMKISINNTQKNKNPKLLTAWRIAANSSSGLFWNKTVMGLYTCMFFYRWQSCTNLYLFKGHIKSKWLIIIWIQGTFLDGRFLLLYSLVVQI